MKKFVMFALSCVNFQFVMADQAGFVKKCLNPKDEIIVRELRKIASEVEPDYFQKVSRQKFNEEICGRMFTAIESIKEGTLPTKLYYGGAKYGLEIDSQYAKDVNIIGEFANPEFVHLKQAANLSDITLAMPNLKTFAYSGYEGTLANKMATSEFAGRPVLNLNLEGSKQLEHLIMNGANLRAVSVKDLDKLQNVSLMDNPSLKYLDLSSQENLTHLTVWNTGLTESTIKLHPKVEDKLKKGQFNIAGLGKNTGDDESKSDKMTTAKK